MLVYLIYSRYATTEAFSRQSKHMLSFLPNKVSQFKQFETISHFLSPSEPPPSMILNRTDDEDHITLPNAATRRKCYIHDVFIASNTSDDSVWI